MFCHASTLNVMESAPGRQSHTLKRYGGATAGSTGAAGAPPNATNSVVSAELRVDTGRVIEANLRHHAATLTLKLVNTAGAEALANTSFSVLTPGGDVIRELVGAFPSLVLAEGEYVVIARRDGKTFQKTFTVQSALDQILHHFGTDQSFHHSLLTKAPSSPVGVC